MNIHLSLDTLFSHAPCGSSHLFPRNLEGDSVLRLCIPHTQLHFPNTSEQCQPQRLAQLLQAFSLVSAYACSAPGHVCYHLMKYIFRMLNMHINYSIDGSGFLRAIPFHCLKNIF